MFPVEPEKGGGEPSLHQIQGDSFSSCSGWSTWEDDGVRVRKVLRKLLGLCQSVVICGFELVKAGIAPDLPWAQAS